MNLARLKSEHQYQERHGATYISDYGHPAHELGDLDDIKAELLALPWITKRTARHEYFMSFEPRQYSYGNRGTGAETYDSQPFSPHVGHFMRCLNTTMQTNFNVCFLNKYDDEHQHLGWHADDFPGMDPSEPIVVVSFGAAREIWVKRKLNPRCPMCAGTGVQTQDNGGDTQSVRCQCLGPQIIPLDQRFLLEEGSLFIMPPGYQDTHLHRIPKHGRPCGWRISLTFRSFKSAGDLLPL